MRSSRRVLLGALLALTALLGGVVGAPSATALVDGIEWALPAATIPVGFPLSVCATDAGAFEPGQEVRVDVMLGGVWTEKATATAPDHQSCIEFHATDILPGPGRYFLRARTVDASDAPVAANTAVTVTTSPLLGLINGVGGGDLYLYTTARDKAVTVELTARGQAVDLQRKSGSRWLHVGRVTVPDTGLTATARFRLPTKAGNVTYRLVSRATTWSPLEITYSFVVHQTDNVTNGNYLIKARQAIAAYCPKTPIYIDTPLTTGAALGFASVERPYDYVNDRPGISSRIDLRSGLTTTALRNQALFQCARVVQGRWVVEGRDATERAKAAYAWGGRSPLGAQAQCMVAPALMYTTDGVAVWGCSTKTQVANAQRMWADYGTRYQAVPYYYDAP
jgi:hypothetical protein